MARGLSYEEITAAPVIANPSGGLAKAQVARGLVAEDLFPTEQKVEEPFEGGSTLKILNPVGADIETGIPIGKTTAQALAGAGKRFVDVGQRARQVAGRPSVQAEIDEAAVRDRPLMATTPGMLGYAAPDIAASMAVPFSSIRAAAGLGAVQGAVTPVTSEDKRGDITNIATGALGGAAGQAVGQGITGAVGKAIHAAPAMIPDPIRAWALQRRMNLPKPVWSNPEEQRLYDLARSKGVPVTIGDIDPASQWASTENVSRAFASGRSPFMQRQQDATRKVIEDLRTQMGTGAGDEGARIAQGIKDQYEAVRKESGRLFRDVEQIAATTKTSPIIPAQTYKTASDIIDDYPAILDEFKNRPALKKFFGIERDMGPQQGLIINPKNMQPFKYPQELTFKEAQETRKALGAMFDELQSAFEKNPKSVVGGGDTVRKAAQLFSSFNKDLDAWGAQAGNAPLNSAWAQARKYFKENVMPYRDPRLLESKSPIIRQMANEDVDTATIADRVLPARETSIARDVMDLSTPSGQRAMKSALIGRMTDASVSPDIQGLGNASLLRHTTKHGHSGEAVFTPAERQAIEDARDIAKLTRRSSEAGTAPPPTGARALPFLAGASTLAIAPTAYMGLGMLGDRMDPGMRYGLAFGAIPLAALAGLRGANRYATSGFGKNIHFAEPRLSGALGRLQEATARGIRGAGEPIEEEFRHYDLGHRP